MKVLTENQSSPLKSKWIDTPLGPMIAIADDTSLYLLEFSERRGLEKELQKLYAKIQPTIEPGETPALSLIEKELKLYFEGSLKTFQSSFYLMGTPFQKQAWDALCKVPYGETRSYGQQAKNIGNPLGHRAVANANGMNQLAIIIPCHRIIRTNGDIGGYGGGINRKKRLIEHEEKNR